METTWSPMEIELQAVDEDVQKTFSPHSEVSDNMEDYSPPAPPPSPLTLKTERIKRCLEEERVINHFYNWTKTNTQIMPPLFASNPTIPFAWTVQRETGELWTPKEVLDVFLRLKESIKYKLKGQVNEAKYKTREPEPINFICDFLTTKLQQEIAENHLDTAYNLIKNVFLDCPTIDEKESKEKNCSAIISFLQPIVENSNVVLTKDELTNLRDMYIQMREILTCQPSYNTFLSMIGLIERIIEYVILMSDSLTNNLPDLNGCISVFNWINLFKFFASLQTLIFLISCIYKIRAETIRTMGMPTRHEGGAVPRVPTQEYLVEVMRAKHRPEISLSNLIQRWCLYRVFSILILPIHITRVPVTEKQWLSFLGELNEAFTLIAEDILTASDRARSSKSCWPVDLQNTPVIAEKFSNAILILQQTKALEVISSELGSVVTQSLISNLSSKKKNVIVRQTI